jgi:hypothetical protein
MEKVTDLLRKHIWQGEKITTFVREKFYQDAFLDTSEIIASKKPFAGARLRPPGAPARPLTSTRYANHFLVPQELGIELESETGNKVLIGRWYRARQLPGVFVSVIKPSLVAEEIIEHQKKGSIPLMKLNQTPWFTWSPSTYI